MHDMLKKNQTVKARLARTLAILAAPLPQGSPLRFIVTKQQAGRGSTPASLT